MGAVISYLKNRSRERSTRLAGLALVAVVGWAAWQWRCEIQHVTVAGLAAAIAALPEYAMRRAWRWFSALPEVPVERVEAGPLTPATSLPRDAMLAPSLDANSRFLTLAHFIASRKSGAAAPWAPNNPQIQEAPMTITSLFECATQAVIADLGPDFCERVVQKLEAEAAAVSPEAAAIVAAFRTAASVDTALGWVKFAAMVLDYIKARAAQPAPVAQPAPEPAQ